MNSVSMNAAKNFCKLACSALDFRKMDVSLNLRGGVGGFMCISDDISTATVSCQFS